MRFQTRTFVALLLASTLALVVSTTLVTTSVRDTIVADVETSLLHQVQLAGALLAVRHPMIDPDAETVRLSALVGARVTFILADGTVVGDSEVEPNRLPRIENHLTRPEVQKALEVGTGVDVRRSVTTGRPTMYAAAAVAEGPIRVVRIGLPLTGVDERVATVSHVLWAGLAAGLLAALLLTWVTSVWLSRRVQAIAAMAGRYREGDFSKPGVDFGRDEIGTVARALGETARDLGTRLEDVARERAHMAAILQGMVEGALLVNAQGRLVVSNPALRAMLRLTDDPQGRQVLEVVRHPDIAAQLTAALAGDTPAPIEVQLNRGPVIFL